MLFPCRKQQNGWGSAAVLIISTSSGKTHLIRDKIIADVIVSLIIACVFYMEDFIIFMTVIK